MTELQSAMFLLLVFIVIGATSHGSTQSPGPSYCSLISALRST